MVYYYGGTNIYFAYTIYKIAVKYYYPLHFFYIIEELILLLGMNKLKKSLSCGRWGKLDPYLPLQVAPLTSSTSLILDFTKTGFKVQ